MKTGLKILIITQGLSRIVEPLLNSEHNVVGILESASRDYDKQTNLYKFLSLARNLYSMLTSNKNSLKQMAKKKNLPYRLMLSSNDLGLVSWIKDLNADVILVFSMSQLLKENIFKIPKLGTINLHPSFLPDYRGPNPDFWQYHDLEMNPGVTVHYIDKGEDTGDIIFQERVYIPLGTKSPERLDVLIGKCGVSIILKALDAINIGEAPRIKQPLSSPTVRARNLTSEEHNTIIDWQNWPVERIWHLLRGTETWLNALTQQKGLMRGQRWIVGNYIRNNTNTSELGKISKENGCYYVGCKDGKIYLTRKFQLKNLIRSLLKR
jgi:methionyl-tRNA formyltransferase